MVQRFHVLRAPYDRGAVAKPARMYGKAPREGQVGVSGYFHSGEETSAAVPAPTTEVLVRRARLERRAAAYKASASTYRNRKPKYMELYSRTPPHIAPIKFIDITLEI